MIFLSRALSALWFGKADPFVKFVRGYYEEQFLEIIMNLGQPFRRRCLLNKNII